MLARPLQSTLTSDKLLNLWMWNGADKWNWRLKEVIHVRYLAEFLPPDYPPRSHGNVLVCPTMPTKEFTALISPKAGCKLEFSPHRPECDTEGQSFTQAHWTGNQEICSPALLPLWFQFLSLQAQGVRPEEWAGLRGSESNLKGQGGGVKR